MIRVGQCFCKVGYIEFIFLGILGTFFRVSDWYTTCPTGHNFQDFVLEQQIIKTEALQISSWNRFSLSNRSFLRM